MIDIRGPEMKAPPMMKGHYDVSIGIFVAGNHYVVPHRRDTFSHSRLGNGGWPQLCCAVIEGAL